LRGLINFIDEFLVKSLINAHVSMDEVVCRSAIRSSTAATSGVAKNRFAIKYIAKKGHGKGAVRISLSDKFAVRSAFRASSCRFLQESPA
jgi:hypothetical protein